MAKASEWSKEHGQAPPAMLWPRAFLHGVVVALPHILDYERSLQ
jgi:hypothetical protein